MKLKVETSEELSMLSSKRAAILSDPLSSSSLPIDSAFLSVILHGVSRADQAESENQLIEARWDVLVFILNLYAASRGAPPPYEVL